MHWRAHAPTSRYPGEVHSMYWYVWSVSVTYMVIGIGSVEPTPWCTSVSRYVWFPPKLSIDGLLSSQFTPTNPFGSCAEALFWRSSSERDRTLRFDKDPPLGPGDPMNKPARAYYCYYYCYYHVRASITIATICIIIVSNNIQVPVLWQKVQHPVDILRGFLGRRPGCPGLIGSRHRLTKGYPALSV